MKSLSMSRILAMAVLSTGLVACQSADDDHPPRQEPNLHHGPSTSLGDALLQPHLDAFASSKSAGLAELGPSERSRLRSRMIDLQAAHREASEMVTAKAQQSDRRTLGHRGSAVTATLASKDSFLRTTTRGNLLAQPIPECSSTGGATCCTAEQLVVWGSSQADHIVPPSTDAGYCVVALAGADAVTVGSTPDTLLGGDGGDFLDAGLGDDLLLAGGGGDFISAGGGHDRVWAEGGDDAIHLDAGDDFAHGGPGNDAIFGGLGQNTLFGGAGDDHIVGGPDADQLGGGDGRDVLVGGEGDDSIVPGAGVDLVDAGPGDDVIIIENLCELGEGSLIDGGPGQDTIWAPVASLDALAALGVTLVDIEGFASIPASCDVSCAPSDCQEDPDETDWIDLCNAYCDRTAACLHAALAEAVADMGGGTLPDAADCKAELQCNAPAPITGDCDLREQFESQLQCIFGNCADLTADTCEVPSCD